MTASPNPLPGPGTAREQFHVMRFGSELEAERVARDIGLLVESELGGAFRRPRMFARILRPASGDRGCLFFSNGALAAARLSGIHLPSGGGLANEMDVRRATPIVGSAAWQPGNG